MIRDVTIDQTLIELARTCKCGGEYRLDAWMNAQVRCTCDGYWFTHRQGSGQCNYNPNRKDWRDVDHTA